MLIDCEHLSSPIHNKQTGPFKYKKLCLNHLQNFSDLSPSS